ncbi:MAG: fructose-specific PTS transporter subunit EIIC [Gordonia sp. (in: high G+C Gram-positive bacteria)]|uniref:PTS fructose transporter subunit IIABC n=1 Tax=Gordonia sp. (in: high G+C Gram-positive bacteria) TaxID=84139 RepID=UPI0039E60020
MPDPIITPDLVLLDVDAGDDATAVINRLADTLGDHGRCSDPAQLAGAALEREAKSPTGLPSGLAIPHARVDSVPTASLGMARLSKKVDFSGPDGPADLVFLIAAPADGGSAHMKLLSSLARSLVKPDFVQALRDAPDAQTVVDLVGEAVDPQSAKDTSTATSAAATSSAAATAATTGDTPAGARSILAITACPTGIAHTYMAADALKLAAEKARVGFAVETQGSSGTTPFTAQEIADADAVIFATDVGVKGRERFAGKPVIESGVKRAINEPDAMISEAVAAAGDPDAHRVSGDASAASTAADESGIGYGGRLKQALLTGVSYMIPFVAAGGLLMALGFLFGGYEIANTTVCDGASVPAGCGKITGTNGSMNDAYFYALNNTLWHLPPGGIMQYLGAVFFAIGSLAMAFMVPVLAGYIAFAIADRPGIAPGFVAGAVSLAVGAGFIGGLIGGLIAGVVALWFTRLKLPRWAAGLMPVVIIPLGASLIVGGVMYMLLGRPLGALNDAMTDGLNSMNGGSKIALGVVLGLMMCFDLGGPVNKAAYAFAVAGLGLANAATPQWEIMAAVMAAGMVPPLALALASTVLRPSVFTEPERENGKAAWLLGASFISEGAIPFAAADPLRVIPPMMLGGAVTGGLAMALGTQLRAPHGGVFVMFAMNGTWWKFLIALAAGVVVGAVGVVITKQLGRTAADEEAVNDEMTAIAATA